MTERLHLEQHPGLAPAPFAAVVTGVEDASLVLDRSAFYPLGGGQPADRGWLTTDLGRLDVLDVRGKGVMTHRVETPDGADLSDLVGTTVEGHIDPEWRALMSRMHTSQHVLSAVAAEHWGGVTAGNQIGPSSTRIDLRFEDRDAFGAAAAIDLANAIVREGREVTAATRPRSQLLTDPLVRVNLDLMPAHVSELRVVEIEDLDRCPCAGTHVGGTDEIGTIELTRVRSKGAGVLRMEYGLV